MDEKANDKRFHDAGIDTASSATLLPMLIVGLTMIILGMIVVMYFF